MSKFIKLTVIGDGASISNRGKETFVNKDHIVEFTQVGDAAGYHARHTRIALATRGIICVAQEALWVAAQLGWHETDEV